jgi:putative ABC transport system permease protein
MAGLVGDFARDPATFRGMAYGYVTLDTMEWLGLPRTFNELSILVSGDQRDKEHIEWVAEQVADRVERGGVTVVRTEVPEPGVLPLGFLVDGMVYLLSAMGVLSLLSSAFLLINTVQALLTQQVQQIGVMKALGARTRHIVVMYLSILLFYGTLSLLIAVPLGSWVARWIIALTTYFVNFGLSDLYFPLHVLALEVGMGLLVPFLAGLWPILSGTRITVREAISSYGLGEGGFGTGFVDRLIEQVRGLPRPLLLSLRNTFRRKGRLVLTLATLVLAGTLFVSIVGVRASMDRLLDDINQFQKYDAVVQFERTYRTERIEGAASSVSGVVAMESWASSSAYRLRADGSEGKAFPVWALPAESNVFAPALVKGRWLRPEDENAIVINTYVLQDEPDVDIGSEIVLDVDDRETTWRIVGVVQPGLPTAEAYANYPYLARLMREVGRASSLYVIAERHDLDAQVQVAKALETHLESTGLNVSSAQTVAGRRARSGVLFDILSTLLMAMAILLAVVGGIGLMGTMLLNVLERIREVGVMRAIGASNDAILQIFIVEGVVIGLIAWVLATILALPLGQVISQAVGMLIWGIPLRFAFPVNGALIWLVVANLLSVLASVVPAHNATRITVRDVLAYVG